MGAGGEDLGCERELAVLFGLFGSRDAADPGSAPISRALRHSSTATWAARELLAAGISSTPGYWVLSQLRHCWKISGLEWMRRTWRGWQLASRAWWMVICTSP